MKNWDSRYLGVDAYYDRLQADWDDWQEPCHEQEDETQEACQLTPAPSQHPMGPVFRPWLLLLEPAEEPDDPPF